MLYCSFIDSRINRKLSFLDSFSPLPYHAAVCIFQSLMGLSAYQSTSRLFFLKTCDGYQVLLSFIVIGLGWILGPASALSHPIMNLQAPQSFIADPDRGQYFIANANGEPGQRDNNGFITKLKPGWGDQ